MWISEVFYNNIPHLPYASLFVVGSTQAFPFFFSIHFIRVFYAFHSKQLISHFFHSFIHSFFPLSLFVSVSLVLMFLFFLAIDRWLFVCVSIESKTMKKKRYEYGEANYGKSKQIKCNQTFHQTFKFELWSVFYHFILIGMVHGLCFIWQWLLCWVLLIVIEGEMQKKINANPNEKHNEH